MTVEILHGIPDSQRDAAVALYDQAFGAKLGVAIPCEKRRWALLRETIDLRFGFAAIQDDELVGLAGYQCVGGSLTGGITFRSLCRNPGWLRAPWAAFIFLLYHRGMTDGQLLMDGIVVDSRVRGQGVGSQLLEAVTDYAREHDYQAVRLDVIDTNDSARRLYERKGFMATKTTRFGYLRWLLGFGASTTMIRPCGKIETMRSK